MELEYSAMNKNEADHASKPPRNESTASGFAENQATRERLSEARKELLLEQLGVLSQEIDDEDGKSQDSQDASRSKLGGDKSKDSKLKEEAQQGKARDAEETMRASETESIVVLSL